MPDPLPVIYDETQSYLPDFSDYEKLVRSFLIFPIAVAVVFALGATLFLTRGGEKPWWDGLVQLRFALVPMILCSLVPWLTMIANRQMYRRPWRAKLSEGELEFEFEGRKGWRRIRMGLQYDRIERVETRYNSLWVYRRGFSQPIILPDGALRDSQHAIRFAEDLRSRILPR